MPQALLKQISTLPSRGLDPFTSLTSPSSHFASAIALSNGGRIVQLLMTERQNKVITAAMLPWQITVAISSEAQKVEFSVEQSSSADSFPKQLTLERTGLAVSVPPCPPIAPAMSSE